MTDVYAQGVCGQLEKDTVNREEICSREFEIFNPKEVCISLKQGNAAPARPVVTVGQRVACGQLIGDGTPGLSVPVYASIAGIVTEILEIPASIYEKVSHIVIRGDKETLSRPAYLKPERSPAQWLKNIGIIEMLHTRQSFYRRCFSGGRVKELKVAAFDREPFVYSDYRLLLECPSKVIFGARVLAGIWGIGQLSIYVCHDEIRYVLEKAVNTYGKVIAPLQTIRFFKVDEHMYARKCSILGKSDGGFWSSAVELCAVYDGFYDEKPMTGRGITVSGAVRQPKNLWVPNGTRIRDLLEYCGGVLGEKSYVDTESLAKRHINIIEGGPLGGHCVNVENAVASLTTESVLVLPKGRLKEVPCIQCQECASVCPVDLKPMHIERAMDNSSMEGISLDAGLCVECGWCSYVCPSGRRLKEKVAAAKKMPLGGPQLSACHIVSEAEDGDRGGYIELDADMAAAMEPLVEESQSGPYIHGRHTTDKLLKKSAVMMLVMLLGYAIVFGPWMLVKGAASAGACLLFELVFHVFENKPWKVGKLYISDSGKNMERLWQRIWPAGNIRLLSTVLVGLVIALAFYGSIPLRWILAADFAAFFVGRITRQSPAVYGITAILVIYGLFRNPMPVVNTGLSVLWMCAFIYLIYEEMIVPWKTLLFLVAFAIFGIVLTGGILWTPTVFMAAVVLLNDYKNAGKDTSMGRILAAFCGAVCGILAAFLPVETAVCLGLLIENIIACNLMTYTI